MCTRFADSTASRVWRVSGSAISPRFCRAPTAKTIIFSAAFTRWTGSSTSYATRRGSIPKRIGSTCWRSRSGGSRGFSLPRNPISLAAGSSSPACAARSARSAVRGGSERASVAVQKSASLTARSPSAPAVNEPQNDQKNDSTDGGHDDGRNDAGAEVDAQLRQQPTADERADDSDADVRDEAIAGASDDLSGKPSRDQADQQNDENRFIRHGHFLPFGDTAHRSRRPRLIHHTEHPASRPAAAARRPHDA